MQPDPIRADPTASRMGADPSGRYTIIARTTLPEEVANRLLTLIRAQELRPGAKLPAERNLAQMMDVSRPVVREALRALALMRVVDIRPGDGTYITSLEPQQLIAHLDFVFPSDSVALEQLLEARRVVEAGNARLAAARISGAELVGIEGLVASLAAAIDEPDRFSDLDIELHSAVCAAAGNFLLSQFMSIVNALGKVSRERTGGRRRVREAALEDHRAILEALQTHDPEAAARAMLGHLDHVEQGLRPEPGAVASRATAPARAPVGAGDSA